jgi:hypothetical protein
VNGRIDAELSGGPAPPPHTGQFDRMSARQVAITGTERAVGAGSQHSAGPGKPGIKKTGTNPMTNGMIRRVVSKFWGNDE